MGFSANHPHWGDRIFYVIEVQLNIIFYADLGLLHPYPGTDDTGIHLLHIERFGYTGMTCIGQCNTLYSNPCHLKWGNYR